MIVSIHQPEHLPYMGFFNKMARCDKYVILDDVQYTKNNFQNRNKIISKQSKELWLTVPVNIKKHIQKEIKDMRIANISNWKKKYISTIEQTYSKHRYFNLYIDELKDLITQEHNFLIELNMSLIYFFRNIFNISTEMIFSSSLSINSTKTIRIVDICKKLNGTVYLSGNGAKQYLDETLFQENAIDLAYQNYEHPVYEARNFVPYLSSLDLIMNCGMESEKIVKKF